MLTSTPPPSQIRVKTCIYLLRNLVYFNDLCHVYCTWDPCHSLCGIETTRAVDWVGCGQCVGITGRREGLDPSHETTKCNTASCWQKCNVRRVLGSKPPDGERVQPDSDRGSLPLGARSILWTCMGPDQVTVSVRRIRLPRLVNCVYSHCGRETVSVGSSLRLVVEERTGSGVEKHRVSRCVG